MTPITDTQAEHVCGGHRYSHSHGYGAAALYGLGNELAEIVDMKIHAAVDLVRARLCLYTHMAMH